MEEEKKAFLLYNDGIDDILALSKESAGTVIQSVYIYVNTGALPDGLTPLEEMVFRHMRQGIDRNNEKWERERRKKQDRAKNAANARWKKFADEHGTTTDELQRLMDIHANACNSMQEHNESCNSIHEQIKHNERNANYANKVSVPVSVNVPVSVPVSVKEPVNVKVNEISECDWEEEKEEGAGGNPSGKLPLLRTNAVAAEQWSPPTYSVDIEPRHNGETEAQYQDRVTASFLPFVEEKNRSKVRPFSSWTDDDKKMTEYFPSRCKASSRELRSMKSGERVIRGLIV